jgi:hypothetical protein
MWMWTHVGCIWHALNSLPVWRLANNHTWCHLKCHVCCMLSFEKVGTIWREWWYTLTSGVSLQINLYMTQGTRSLLLMWWLLIRCGRWWLRMSLVDQHVQLQNLMPLLKSANIKGFMTGTTLFWWPWKCMAYMGTIWIVSSWSVPIFPTIDNREVTYPCLFAFNFLSNVLVLFFNVL